MKALVTGANGFIGRSLTKRLVNDGFLVRVLSRSKAKPQFDNVDVIYGDLTSSEESLFEIAIGCDVIFHCAGEINDQYKMQALHVEGTKKLIDAINKSIELDGKPKHLIQLSSVGAYGPSLNPNLLRVVTEECECNPLGEYEITKTLSDQLIINSSHTYTILRPSNVVGLFMKNQSFRGLLSFIKKRQFFFIGSKSSIATYIHIDDVVEALILCASDKRAKNHIFNLSNDCQLMEVANRVALSDGLKGSFLCLPEKPLRLFVRLFSKFFRLPLTSTRIDALVSKTTYPSTKIKDVLGFSPTRSIPDFAVEYCRHWNL